MAQTKQQEMSLPRNWNLDSKWFTHAENATNRLIKSLQKGDKIMQGRWDWRPCGQRWRRAGGAGGGQSWGWKDKTLIWWFQHKCEQVEEEMEEEDNVEESHDGQEAPAQEDKADGKE